MRVGMSFDLLITGATVVDGTGSPRFTADIGIRGGRFSAIGNLADTTAGRRIDASDHVVTPGFIDIHTHSDVSLLADPGGESKVHQGVTTEVTGNCSFSPFPVGDAGVGALMQLLGRHASGGPWEWTDLDGWAAAHETRGISINLAPLVGHAAIRLAVGLVDDRPPTRVELRRMERLVTETMEQGAFGFSTGLTLTPSSYATTDEIAALASVLRAYPPAFYATHARLWAGNHVRAIEESAEVGRRAGVPVQYSHMAIIDSRAHGHPEAMTGVVERARTDGLDMTFDVYPYTAAGTHLMQLLPEWLQEGGVEAMLARLRDGATRQRALDDTRRGWFRGLPWVWESIVISDIGSARNRGYVGRSLAAVAAERRVEPARAALELIDEEDNLVGVVAHNRLESDMRFFLRHEASMIGSDGDAISPTGVHGPPQMPHPRFYGTYPRILGQYARDEPVLTLEAAVAKMSGRPAARLGLTDRGRIAEGLAADVVVLDPATVLDQATFENPHRLPIGIRDVLVAGVPVVEDGRHTGARPGRVLRRHS